MKLDLKGSPGARVKHLIENKDCITFCTLNVLIFCCVSEQMFPGLGLQPEEVGGE